MADTNLNAAPRPHAHPQAGPGYGKRSAPGQRPRRKGDFAGLPLREAYLAAFIDRLPDGSAIDVKSLAREQPLYGQQAVAAGLNALIEAGYLRRFKDNIGVDGATRWVWRSYFSRTARDERWWLRVEAGDAVPDAELDGADEVAEVAEVAEVDETGEGDEAKQADPEPVAGAVAGSGVAPCAEPEKASVRPRRSEAYDVLASLGSVDARLLLSAKECEALEADAAAWFARGAGRAQIVKAMTAGLPPQVHTPGGFVRSRLREKLPPEPPEPSSREAAAPRRVMVCAGCGTPAGALSLSGGRCQDCRRMAPEDVRKHVRVLRELTASVATAGRSR